MGRYTGSNLALLLRIVFPGARVRHVRLRRPFGNSVSYTGINATYKAYATAKASTEVISPYMKTV